MWIFRGSFINTLTPLSEGGLTITDTVMLRVLQKHWMVGYAVDLDLFYGVSGRGPLPVSSVSLKLAWVMSMPGNVLETAGVHGGTVVLSIWTFCFQRNTLLNLVYSQCVLISLRVDFLLVLRTAVYGPVRTVVWEVQGASPAAYSIARQGTDT